MYLYNDLYTIYGDILVKKGQEITSQVVKNIRKIGESHKQVRVPLKSTDLFTDFKKIFNDARYAAMFRPPITKKDICDIAGKLMIENDLLLELSNMKSNLPYTYYHVMIIAGLSIKLSLLYMPQHYDREIVTHCGFTHDIGKTRIPISLLEKSAKLTKKEWAIIETHPITGYLLLNYYLKSDRVICALASLDHHERLDGSGYPKGIRCIDKYTQLISPIDVMDALMTKRPYRRESFNLRASLDYLIMQARAGKLNMNVVKTIVSMARKGKSNIRSIKLAKLPREETPGELTHDKYR